MGNVINNGNFNNILEERSLVKDRAYGTRAQVIYDICCDVFNFDYSKRKYLGMLQPMYAREATLEKYDVWFLTHSNLTNTNSEGKFNIVNDDIVIYNWDKDLHVENDVRHNNIRVIFVKKKNDVYYFHGLFECIEVDYNRCKATYKLISDIYPRE